MDKPDAVKTDCTHSRVRKHRKNYATCLMGYMIVGHLKITVCDKAAMHHALAVSGNAQPPLGRHEVEGKKHRGFAVGSVRLS